MQTPVLNGSLEEWKNPQISSVMQKEEKQLITTKRKGICTVLITNNFSKYLKKKQPKNVVLWVKREQNLKMYLNGLGKIQQFPSDRCIKSYV